MGSRHRRIRRFERKRQRSINERELQVVQRDGKPESYGQTPEAWAATWAAP